jgi:hypothetical protein
MKFKAKCHSSIPARMGPMSGETSMLATKGKQIVFLPKKSSKSRKKFLGGVVDTDPYQ